MFRFFFKRAYKNELKISSTHIRTFVYNHLPVIIVVSLYLPVVNKISHPSNDLSVTRVAELTRRGQGYLAKINHLDKDTYHLVHLFN